MDGWKAAVKEAAALPLAAGGPGADVHRTAAPPSSLQGLPHIWSTTNHCRIQRIVFVLGSVFMFQRRRVPINWRHLGQHA